MGDLHAGTVLFAKYAVDRLIAVGATSRLYLGHPLHGAGQVAVKQLDSEDADDLEQFDKEYVMLLGLDHPGLAHVLDFFVQGDRHYLVQEFVHGLTLEQRLEAGSMELREAVRIIDALLDVLGYLHRRGIVYRDLKPANVIVQPNGTVRLVDFGTARRWKRGAARDTIPLGTPGYAPPEQYGTRQSDARSDVFAAGVLLHHMLTGVPPPVAGWELEPPCKIVTGLPQGVSEAVVTATQVSPGARFQDTWQMQAALARAMGLPVPGPHAVVARCATCGASARPGRALCSTCAPPSTRSPWGAFLRLCAGLLFLAGVASLVLPNFVRARCHPLTSCKSNLKNIGTALEMYSTDHGGRFPQRLCALAPDYLRRIPSCPSVGAVTYIAGYVSASDPDAYTVVCAGANHGSVYSDNYPQYTSAQGLMER